MLTIKNTTCNTWFERDRAMILIEDKKTGETIAEFWDETVGQLVEDGFLNPKDWHGSSISYLNDLWGNTPWTPELHNRLMKSKNV